MTPRQESDTLPARTVLALTTFVVAATVVGVVVAWLLQGCAHRGLGGRPFTGSAKPSPPREVQAVEMGLFARSRAEAPTALDGYEWVDRDAGVVRIPIERAFDLYLARQGATP